MNNASAWERSERGPLARALVWRPGLWPSVLAAGGAFGLLTAYLLVHHSPTEALALALLPPIALLLTRSYGGVIAGTTMALTLPYSLGLGSAQVSVDRVSSAMAAISLGIAAARGRRWRFHPFDAAVLLYFMVLVLGWLLQNEQAHVGRLVGGELTPIGFYLGARRIPRKHIRLVLFVILFAGTIGALTVLFERAVGHPVFPSPLNAAAYAGSLTAVFRPSGVFGAPPLAGAVLGFVFVVGLACVSATPRRLRLITVASLVICALAIVLTFTRVDLIGTGMGVVVFLVLVRSSLLKPLRAAWVVVAIVAVVLVALPSVDQSTTFQQGIVRPGSLSGREKVWQLALPIATASTHNFLFGVGTGVLEYGSNTLSTVAIAPSTITVGIQNQYLTTLVENGAIGVIALLLLLVGPALIAGRAAISTRDPVRAALAAGIVVLAVALSANTLLLDSPVEVLLLVAVGLIANLGGAPEQTDG